MNEYHRIITSIQTDRRENKMIDVIALMAFCTTIGINITVGFFHAARRGYLVKVRMQKRDHPGVSSTEVEERIPTNSFMRYDDNRMINDIIVGLIEEAARKRRGA